MYQYHNIMGVLIDQAMGVWKGVTMAPKISIQDIEDEIQTVCYMTGDRFVAQANITEKSDKVVLDAGHTTLCMVVMKNGFIVVGQATPASPENFDAAMGRKLAYERCVMQIWPLLGYMLREQLHHTARPTT
jgi:hypothetical protein